MAKKKPVAKVATAGEAVAMAAKRFGLTPEDVVKSSTYHVSSEARDYIKNELRMDPACITRDAGDEAAKILRDEARAYHLKLQEMNDSGAVPIQIVIGHHDLDPALNPTHRANLGRQNEAKAPPSPATNEAGTMKVSKKAAVSLLTQLGFAQADKYTDSRLQKRLHDLDEIVDEKKAAGVKDPASAKLMKAVLAARAKGEDVEVVGDKATSEETTEKPAKKLKAKKLKAKKLKAKKAPEVADEEDEEAPQEARKAKKGSGADPKGPKGVATPPDAKEGGVKKDGIIATIAKCLLDASEDTPTTKDAVHKHLKKTFPERQASSLLSTINHQIPSYLRKSGYDVQKNSSGYWIKKKAKKA